MLKTHLKIWMGILITLAVLAIGFFWLTHIITTPLHNTGDRHYFQIKSGESFATISQRLEEEGIISSRYALMVYLLWSRHYQRLQAGDYYLSPQQNMIQIVQQIASGEAAVTRVTIIEGWNLAEIDHYLGQNNLVSSNEFIAQASSSLDDNLVAQFAFLAHKPRNRSLEGYLFPDTYEIKVQENADGLIKKMLGNFDQKFSPEMRVLAQKNNKSIDEIVIMASLLEREVKTMADKQVVAGILWKRLAANWPLQVDATLAYILNKGSRQLTLDDLKVDSPYNTYLHTGLPYGPICNPGLESLKAALTPQDSPYWFYLSSPDGATVFSKDFAEHLANQKKYLK